MSSVDRQMLKECRALFNKGEWEKARSKAYVHSIDPAPLFSTLMRTTTMRTSLWLTADSSFKPWPFFILDRDMRQKTPILKRSKWIQSRYLHGRAWCACTKPYHSGKSCLSHSKSWRT